MLYDIWLLQLFQLLVLFSSEADQSPKSPSQFEILPQYPRQ